MTEKKTRKKFSKKDVEVLVNKIDENTFQAGNGIKISLSRRDKVKVNEHIRIMKLTDSGLVLT